MERRGFISGTLGALASMASAPVSLASPVELASEKILSHSTKLFRFHHVGHVVRKASQPAITMVVSMEMNDLGREFTAICELPESERADRLIEFSRRPEFSDE